MANPLDRSVPHHHMAPGNTPHFMQADGHSMAGMQGLGQMPPQPTEYSFVMPRDAPQHTPLSPSNSRKRRASDVDPEPGQQMPMQQMSQSSSAMHYSAGPDVFHTMQQQQQPQQQHQPPPPGVGVANADPNAPPAPPLVKKSRTNTPWTPAEEHRLKLMRDAGNSWSEIAKTFPNRTEGSVKKHWYKDMHYAEFAEDESAALLAAIKEYENSKWKVIGAKLGKPAKACEQYAKEHFSAKT